jgi:hypothetical protein
LKIVLPHVLTLAFPSEGSNDPIAVAIDSVTAGAEAVAIMRAGAAIGRAHSHELAAVVDLPALLRPTAAGTDDGRAKGQMKQAALAAALGAARSRREALVRR